MIGANGFLGSAVCAALRAAGVPVAEFTRAAPFVSGSGDPAPEFADADVVYYLASAANPGTAEKRPELVDEERAAFETFLDARSRLSPLPLVVFPGSGGTVYDTDVPPPYNESSPVKPRGRYGTSRLQMERALLATGSATVLRISNVYGPGQRVGTGQGVIAHWVAAAAKKEPITLFGNPDSTRDFVFIEDVARAALAVTRDAPPVVNIGSGVATSLRELADLIADVMGGVEIRQEPDRGFDVPHNWLDVTLAREALGWTPAVTLREGVERVCRDSVAG